MVRSDCPLAQFHAKFLGKSMTDEEQEWRNSQRSQLSGELRGRDQDGDEGMPVDEDGDEGMDGGDGTD
jgi:hypothetical protein